MKVKFYLKRPKAATETALYALINYNGSNIKVYTGESILPKYWNKDTNSARATPKFSEHPEFNQRLNNIRSTISKVFLDYKNSNNHSTPPPAIFKPMVEKALKKGEVKVTFIDYFDDFVQRSFRGQRIDPRSKKPIRHGVAKVYQSTFNQIKAFSQVSKRKVDFDTIDLEFHKEFTQFLTEKPYELSLNTIGSNFQRIKAVLAEATERGANSNMTFKSRFFIKQSEEADTIYLNREELQEIIDLKLEKDGRLDNVRDLFLIGCFTGLRFSDFSILKPENIANGYIQIKQVKTGDPVTIPVHPEVRKILEKRDGKLPRAISNVKLNLYLKDLGKETKLLKKTESKSITKGGTKRVTSPPKHDLITTHTARRSFATNEYLAGTPSITIMAITGHKTEKSFLKYIRVTSTEHAEKIKEMWDKRENNLVAV